MLTGPQIRETFLRFFESKGHRRVHSSSLVPANDPTLLFTNAGMNQFKDVFLGLEKRDYTRATTSQKCVRAGGKHNDLENVGFTKRHHTFFEMLGNFSFGDYFKKKAIAYAWELVTSKEWFGIDKSKLYCTIFKGEQGIARDDEAEKYWIETGVSKDRIFALGMKDNFWAMGDTGPCGPCSEIYYDMGVAASEQGHTDCKFPCECGRYVEIWNLVFMQFDRDAAGKYNPLPKPSVDTGMGLERTTAVLQGKLSNYETDLFIPLIEKAADLCHYDDGVPGRLAAGLPSITPESTADLVKTNELIRQNKLLTNPSLRIIADHARASAFLICDGVYPSNEGRGYVLRKILRRGIRHGRLLGQDQPFAHEMVDSIRSKMGGAYPELNENAERIKKTILAEEQQFTRVILEGSRRFDMAVAELIMPYAAQYPSVIRNLAARQSEDFDLMVETLKSNAPGKAIQFFIKNIRQIMRFSVTFPGTQAFHLYETYGLPFDFIQDACRDLGIDLDVSGFEEARSAEQARARTSWKGVTKATASPAYRDLNKTVFEGYRQTESHGCEVLAIVKDAQGVQALRSGEQGEIVLDHTPFYADSGGQVGDIGIFYNSEHNAIVADVNGCYAPVQGVRAHKVVARQPIHVGMKVDAVVHADVREATKRNHTATHLLHAALRETLGKHVKQAGSLVDPGHLRFDFSHFTGVADEELQDIEDMVNKEVLRNAKVETIEDVPIDVAVNEYKAMALFGEKYGERVRVVRIGAFSTELCGGTHTTATGEIGLIKILSEGSVSSGVRRVEAVTGHGSLQHFRYGHQLQSVVATLVPGSHKADSPAEALRAELEKKDSEIKKLQKELEQLRMKSAASTVASVDDKVREVKGVKVLVHRVDNLEREQMRTLVDNLRNKLGSGVVVLGSAQEDKVALTVGVTKDLTARIQAGKIIKPVAEKVGGSGGGRPDMAEAGGKDPGQLDAALAEVYSVVEALLQ
ncbi:MAG TPA: alanine--tRNA ligase [Candidatus Saccharimonadales bacterium]|jgi:alanyl-tRNA synthetase|nr:alanine--tRNA ligase [Candidatus Saccharimonadales bacterium]